jgi:NAD(P)-dependent dehydrogenase (short-subunit alcohol dehydrogenase family)
MASLKGKTALVTGGSRGIGRATAERLARDGALVAVHYASNAGAASEVVSAIGDSGGRAFAVRSELGSPDGAGTLWSEFDQACRQHGDDGLDILVNNAGIAIPGRFDAATPSDFDRMFAVNVRAPFFLTQQGLQRLRAGGRIVNISSAITRLALPDAIGYGLTKGALDVFSLILAKELGPLGITVNAIAPGFVDTDANADWLRDNTDAQASTAAMSALGRVGRPEDIAEVVAFLASDAGGWITGQVIDASGGTRL